MKPMAMAAAACGADGLMIEVHNDPIHALCDGAQSLTRDAKQRRENVAGVYALDDGADVSGLRILLVDDVVTTGATMSEAARILRKAGAKSVFGVTLARHED